MEIDLDLSDPRGAPPEHVAQVNQFNRENRLDTRVAPGYKDGGRQAQYDEDSGKTIIHSKRETIVFKSPDEDPVLKRTIDKAKADMAGMTSTEQKAQYLSNYVDKLLHKANENEAIIDRIAPPGAANRQVSLGQLIEAETGVCRHRSLLFKVLADETGVPASLVRGRFDDGRGNAGAHAWNEVQLENGKKILVDVMHGNTFRMDQPEVQHYQNFLRQPLYDQNGPIQNRPKPTAPSPSTPNRAQAGLDIDLGEPQKPAQQQALQADDERRIRLSPEESRNVRDHIIISTAEAIHTTKGVYLSIEGQSAEKIDALKQSLQRQGIQFEEKRSGLNGGTNVLSLDHENAQKLAKVQSTDPLPVRPAPAPQKPEAAAAPIPDRAPVADEDRRIRFTPEQGRMMRDHIAIASAETIHSNKGLYVSIQGKSPEQIDALKQAMQRQGIQFEEKTSSVNGGTKVLALDGENANKFSKAQSSPPAFLREQPAHAPSAQPAAPAAEEHRIQLSPQQAEKLRDQAALSRAETIHTTKGTYISIQGQSPEQVADLKQAMQRQGIHFEEKTSSLNGGTKVLSLDTQNAAKFSNAQKGSDATLHSTQIQPAATAAAPPSAPPQPPASQQTSHESSTTKTEQTSSAPKTDHTSSQPPATQGENSTTVKKPAVEATETHGPRSSGGSSVHANGAKVDGAAGKLGTAVQAAARVAEGDNVGAAKVVAEAAATKFAITQIAKKIPVIGAVVTVGTTLWSAGAQAAQGNYGKAGAELAAGAAEAAGNVVGFGAGDAAREVVRAGIQVTAGDKYAPEKSGLRQMAETAVDVAKKVGSKGSAQEPFNKASASNPSAPSVAIANPAQYRGQSTAQLADTIQKDPVLPDTVKMGGKEVKLCDALKDKTFRTTFVQSLESAAAKGVDVGQQVAMIKAYEQKLDQPSATASTNAPKNDVAASASPPPRRQVASVSEMGPMA